MGATFITVSIYNVKADQIRPFLLPSDTLRTNNAPWCTILPGEEEMEAVFRRMEKLPRTISAALADAAVLRFFYFDDDYFRLTLFRAGKVVANLHSGESWAKFGKALNELLQSEEPTRAFRMAKQCTSLDEQLSLLEETLGVALYDLPEAPERAVSRSHDTYDAIKQREDMLRKRPNRFQLVPVAEDEWPKCVRAKIRLFRTLGPRFSEFHSLPLLLDAAGPIFTVPNHEDWAVLYTEKPRQVFVYDASNNDLRVFPVAEDVFLSYGTLWLTKNREPVVEQLSPRRMGGIGAVACLNQAGGFTWRFAPSLAERQSIEFAHATPSGVLTLYTRISPNAPAMIWRISGESGEVLCSRQLDEADEPDNLEYMPDLGGFAYYALGRNELVLIDESLQEIKRWAIGERCIRFDVRSIYQGTRAYHFGDASSVDVFDFESGELSKISLETSGDIWQMLPGDYFVSYNKPFCVYDKNGRVVSRHKLRGELRGFLTENGANYVVEGRGFPTSAFISDEIINKIEYCVWKIQEING